MFVPPAVVTLTPTEPAAAPAGTVTVVSWVSEDDRRRDGVGTEGYPGGGCQADTVDRDCVVARQGAGGRTERGLERGSDVEHGTGLLVPPAVAMVTPTLPVPEGDTAVTWVGETSVAVVVTSVPPPVDPWFGEMGMERLLADKEGTEAQRDPGARAALRGGTSREDGRLNRAAGSTEFPRKRTEEEPADTAPYRDPRSWDGRPTGSLLQVLHRSGVSDKASVTALGG